MKLNRSMMLALIILLGIVPALYAQDEMISVNVETSRQSKFRRMDTIPLNIHFSIAEGYYVYAKSNPFAAMPFEAMKIEFDVLPAGIETTGNWQWPAAIMYHGNEVYMGKDHQARQLLLVTRSCKPGMYKLKGTISFQACNEDMCFPSQEISFEKELLIKK